MLEAFQPSADVRKTLFALARLILRESRAPRHGRHHPDRSRGGRAPPGDRPGVLPDDRADLRATAARRDPAAPLPTLVRTNGARSLPPVHRQPGALLPPPAGPPAGATSPARPGDVHRSRGRELHEGERALRRDGRARHEETRLLPLLLRDDAAVRPGLSELHDPAQPGALETGAHHVRRPSTWSSTSSRRSARRAPSPSPAARSCRGRTTWSSSSTTPGTGSTRS